MNAAVILAIPGAALAGLGLGSVVAASGIHDLPYPPLVTCMWTAGGGAALVAGAWSVAARVTEKTPRTVATFGFVLVWLVAVLVPGYVVVPLGFRESGALPQAVLPVLFTFAASFVVGFAAIAREHRVRRGVGMAVLAIVAAELTLVSVLLATGIAF